MLPDPSNRPTPIKRLGLLLLDLLLLFVPILNACRKSLVWIKIEIKDGASDMRRGWHLFSFIAIVIGCLCFYAGCKIQKFYDRPIDKSTSLKQRAQLLANQLTDFADEMDNDKVPTNLRLYQNEWDHRFPNKIDALLKELDAQGQFSQKIEKESNGLDINGYGVAFQTDTAAKIRDVASEIKRMADDLPESKKP